MLILRRAAHWKIPLFLILVCAFVALFTDAGEYLRYDRGAIGAGEYWRLITGHLAHLGWRHLALNVAGLTLVWLLVGRSCSDGEWLAIVAASVTAMAAGFWFLEKNLQWYVGLSGLLHGLLVAGAMRSLRPMPAEALILLTGVTVKLAWEQWVGPLPGSESMSGGRVVVDAHLYGALGGAAGAIVLRRSVLPAAPI